MFLQLLAGCLGLGVLIGPTLLALANQPPIAAATSWTPPRLLAVKPFHDLGGDTCIRDLPVYAGPTAVQGTVVPRQPLEQRLAAAMFACVSGAWSGGVTISATVDARGTITGVEAEGDTSPVMQRCLTNHVIHSDEPITTRGPGTLRAGYFMGR